MHDQITILLQMAKELFCIELGYKPQ